MPVKQVTFKGPRFDITVSGDSAAAIVSDYQQFVKELDGSLASKKLIEKPSRKRTSDIASRQTTGLSSEVANLVHEGFFDEKRTLPEVKEKLAKKGIVKPLTTLSGVMKGLVKKKVLQRDYQDPVKKKPWVYWKPS